MVTYSKDYIDLVLEKFPFFSKSELKEIIDAGLKAYAYANRFGADITLFRRFDDPIVIHTGPLGYDSLKHYWRWVTKYRMKERVLYKLRGEKWDGYYYIGLTEEEHLRAKKSGKKVKIFINCYPTKIKKELYHNKIVKHIWRVPYPIDCGFKFFCPKLTSRDAEYIGENQYGKYHQCFHGRSDIGHASTNDIGNTTN